ncbi:MAG: MYXO-CTERM sorting domain-containing protein [Sandaracinaceae bacterium]|nr:MYXO-CTERM sorting domain-containing protein [Sandaracinaceae bacterium]
MRATHLGFILGLFFTLLTVPAAAEPTFWDLSYPYASPYECIDCHVHPLGGGSCSPMGSTVHPRWPCLNPFGRTFRLSASGYTAAMGSADTDGDGTINSAELQATRSAGMPQGAQGVGCDMLAAATLPGTWVTCGTTYVQIQATYAGITSPVGTPPGERGSYTLAYRCLPGTSPAVTNSDTDWTNNCLDIDECAGNPCAPGTCIATPLGASWSAPGYECGCPAGFADTGSGCVLVNECDAGTDDCASTANCIDTPGTSAVYTCECPNAGYAGDGRASPGTGCTNIDECAGRPCGSFATSGGDGFGCIETPLTSWSSPGFTCECQTGYEFNGSTCVLADECTASLDDCDPVAACIDPSMRSGDWICTCPTGYLGGGHGAGGCRDIDECAMGLDDCGPGSICNNTGGGFTCDCPTGFERSGAGCVDIDECMDVVLAGACDLNSVCTNRPGSYECVCNMGYRGGLATGCSDIDECAEGSSDCDPDAICTNTAGRWTCACGDGWVGDGLVCDDINECDDPTITSRCSSASTCENLPGSWRCACDTGYEGDGFTCNDVDECMTGTHGCDPAARCENTNGSYRCTCATGYRGSGFECTDIDECAESTDDCGPTERCVNQIGMAPTCVCMAGYVRDDMGECVIACGDGRVGPGETCDDGGTTPGDGCDDFCRTERGWACYEPTGEASVCTETCGDGFVDPSEDCDDGDANADAPDACRTDCTLPSCGDGLVDTGEECDEGDGNDDTTVDGCRTTCHEAYCGDGVVDTGELCDPGGIAPETMNFRACNPDCPMAGDAGTGMEPPMDGGCSCRATPGSSAPWALVMLALGALFVWRRQRG